MLNGGFQRFFEWNRLVEVEAINARLATCLLRTHYGRTIELIRKWLASEVPCTQKIILRARSNDRWCLRSVDEKHVVAFAPPLILVLQHRHGHPHELAVSLCLHPDIVVLTIEIGLVIDNRVLVGLPAICPPVVWLGLIVLSVKIQCARRQRTRVGTVVDVVVEGMNRLLALIGNRDSCVMLERHGEVRVQTFLASHGKHCRLPGMIFSQAEAEKVTDGSFNAR